MTEYDAMAKEFLKKHGCKLSIKRSDDFKPITNGLGYRVMIKRIVDGKLKQWSFNFSDSVYNMENNKKPTEYDVLACITKYDPNDFEDFCNDYGYSIYDDYGRINKESKKTYNAVLKEWYNVRRMFDDCLDELAEIN